jgi:hypothetical protein
MDSTVARTDVTRVEAAIRELCDTRGVEAYLADNLVAAKTERDEAIEDAERLRAALGRIGYFASLRAEDAADRDATEQARLWRGVADRASQALTKED